ncbi:hypothetical protein [Anabaena lutea]|uniref:Uncharacterized protein n=1 Tax=Anabaena lutea FACHB-196 TaxID=2692881 RepID=A0ABR8F9Y0_9NOST|nr:hypothetical protein [Anabaena lutea]MBD2566421.1 hypothetical protein [Anabaena lutea FACHB-196]
MNKHFSILLVLFLFILIMPANAEVTWIPGKAGTGERLGLVNKPVTVDYLGITRFRYAIQDNQGYRERSAATPWCLDGKIDLDYRHNPMIYKIPSWWAEVEDGVIFVEAESQVAIALLTDVCKAAKFTTKSH